MFRKYILERQSVFLYNFVVEQKKKTEQKHSAFSFASRDDTGGSFFANCSQAKNNRLNIRR